MGDRREPASGPAPPRVALFTNNYLPRVSGVAVAVDFLERALRAAGHETLVVAPDYGGEPELPGARVRRVRSIQLRRWGAAIPLPLLDAPLREVALFAPDVLHAHHPFLNGEAAVCAADALGLPLVYTFHTLYESFLHYVRLDFGPVARGVRAFVRRFVERCDLVVAPTEPVRRHLVSEWGVSVPTATAPTGLDPERFSARALVGRGATRAALGLGGRAPLLVWAGRVAEEKDPRIALATLAALVERGHDAGLVFLGDGPLAGGLARQAKRLGLDGRVAFAGFVDQERLPALLAAGDVFLFTSWNDTQGIVAYEAWAAGLPIVAVPSMAGQAVVEPGRNGLLAGAEARELASAVEALRDRPELGNAPFPWERFGPAALAAHWRGLYAEAEAAGRRSAAGITARAARVPGRFTRRRAPLVGADSD
ncbi:MAG TPA: glycosyltransferase [Thermoanaerobaculia bacterium]|nr:glycosyltransferase [Thermoanaerobaculia bacterium]